jgi:hypothetical protein
LTTTVAYLTKHIKAHIMPSSRQRTSFS